jgi:hypothetical protein
MVIVRRLVAAAVAVVVFFAASSALAAINQKVSGPGNGEVAGDTVSVGTDVGSTYAIVSVTVTIGGVTTPLPLVGGIAYQATVPLDAFPEGPLAATITATNVVGETVSATQTFIHDRVPTLTIASPGDWTYRSAVTPIRVKATCSDTAIYPCDHLVVSRDDGPPLNRVVIASVAGANIDQDISVPDRTKAITVEAYDTLGLKRSVTIPLAYDATPGLSVLHRVPGRALDMDATRILYTSRAGLFIRDIATGVDARVGDDVGDGGTGALTLTGAVRDERWVSANRRYYVEGLNVTGAFPGSRPITVDAQTGTPYMCPTGVLPYSTVIGIAGVTDVGNVLWTTKSPGPNPSDLFICALPDRPSTTFYSQPTNDIVVSGESSVFSLYTGVATALAAIATRAGQLAPSVPVSLVPKYVQDSKRMSGRARVDFDNPERVAPAFDLLAQTDIRRTTDTTVRSQWRVNLHAYGTPERVNLEFSAEPSLALEDIVLLLLFRLTRAEMERVGGGNAGQAVGIELLSRSLGLDRVVQGALPFIDEFRPGSTYNYRSGVIEPSLSLGGRITDTLRWSGMTTFAAQPLIQGTLNLRVGRSVAVQVFLNNATNQPSTQVPNAGVDVRWRLIQ